MRKCLHCKKELIGQQRLYCCDNHKRYVLRKEKELILKELKLKIPEIFESNFEYSEVNYLKYYINHRDLIQKYIDNLIEETKNIC